MKNKIVLAIVVMALVSSLFLVTANAACNLPASVTLTVGAGNPPVIITLSGIVGSYDIANGPYTGYCIELGTAVGPPPISATPICTDNAGSPWNQINWLLNNYPDSLDLQLAIWRLQGNSEAFITSQGWTFTVAAVPMATAASAHGTFDPSAGDWVGVRLETGGQDLLIKVKIPELAPGLTPGFWKNNLAVYLGYANGNRGYSDPTGADPNIVTKDTMADFFDTFARATLEQLYTDLTTMGNNAEIRNAAANVFNVAAGLAAGPPWN